MYFSTSVTEGLHQPSGQFLIEMFFLVKSYIFDRCQACILILKILSRMYVFKILASHGWQKWFSLSYCWHHGMDKNAFSASFGDGSCGGCGVLNGEIGE